MIHVVYGQFSLIRGFPIYLQERGPLMSFFPIFTKMVELFLILIIGYIAAKAGIINKDVKQAISKLILYVTMPCTILSSVINSTTLPGTSEIIYVLGIAFLSYVILFILALLTPKVLGLKESQVGVAFFAVMFGNVGFIGFPVTEAIYGRDAVFYASIFNMPFNLLAYSLGVYMLRKHSGNDDSGKIDLSFKKLFLTPALISSVVSIILALTKLSVPGIIGEPIGLVSNITTPGALIIIGAALAEMPFLQMFQDLKAHLLSFLCIVVSPAVTYLCFTPFTSGMPLKIAVLMAAMPVATAGTMLCVEHQCDEEFMAKGTFLTTLFTIPTIPCIAMLMEILP